MSKYSDKFYEMLHKNSIKRRRMVSLLLVLSMFTASGVVWTLRDTGITMANKDDDFSSLTASLGNSPQALANELYKGEPDRISTIDNIARGINITLFDYAVLSTNNNGEGSAYYNERTGEIQTEYTGINSTIFAGENDSGIYFFPYSSNPLGRTQGNGEYTDNDKVYHEAVQGGAGRPSKNTYSGDYQLNVWGNSNEHQSGNRAVQGIVKNRLEQSTTQWAQGDLNKYPVVNNNGPNLAYLFDDKIVNTVDGEQCKWVYPNTNGLLKEVNRDGDKHLVYDSNKNYAYFDRDNLNKYGGHDFRVYGDPTTGENGTFRLINDDHHQDGDPKAGGGSYDDGSKDSDFMIGFFPFDKYNTENVNPNFDTAFGKYNHHFGMKMDAKFTLPNSATANPITFSYSGDDDMWVFIDDRLVLDIGGIHEPCAGMIDFTNGLVWVQDNARYPNWNSAVADDKIQTTVEGKLNRTFTHNEWDKFPKPEFGFTTGDNLNTGNQWVVKTIQEVYGEDWSAAGDHQLNMFYLERGGCYSNLSMDMNLPFLKPLVVAKNVDYGTLSRTPYSDELYSSETYEFELMESSDVGETYHHYDVSEIEGKENPFTIKANETYSFEDLDPNNYYYVVEKNVDQSIYQMTDINGVTTWYSNDSGKVNTESLRYKLDDQNVFYVTNKVREELTDLDVEKVWQDDKTDHAQIYYKINQTTTDAEGASVKKPFPIEREGMYTLTQSLSSSNGWKEHYANLPKRYGNKTYSYEVVESFVSSDYNKPDYIWEGNKVKILNVKKTDNAEIHIKKDWVHTPDSQLLPVNLELRRKYTTDTVNEVNVTVKMVDANGVEIATPDTKKAYAGGELEFSVTPPMNAAAPTISSSQNVNVTDVYDHIIYEVTNIPETDTIITIKYNNLDVNAGSGSGSSSNDQPQYVLYNNFNSLDETTSWNVYQNNNYTIECSNGGKHSGSTAFAAQGVQTNYSGAGMKLGDLGLQNGQEYTFLIYAAPNTNQGTNSVDLAFMLKDSQYGNSNEPKYFNSEGNNSVSGNPSQPDTWKKMILSYAAGDWSNYYIKVEAMPINNERNQKVHFYLDDFVIVKGNHVNDLSVSNGKVYVGETEYVSPTAASSNSGSSSSTLEKPVSKTKLVEHKGFAPDVLNGWYGYDTVLTGKNDAGQYMLLEQEIGNAERIQAVKDLYNSNSDTNLVQPGKKYRFKAQFAIKDQNNPLHAWLQLHWPKNGETHYGNEDEGACVYQTLTDYNQPETVFEFTIPENVSYVKLVAGNDTGNTTTEGNVTKKTCNPMLIYNYTIEEIIDPAVAINPNSVTKHPVPTNKWQEDNTFTPIQFTLDSSNDWKWNNANVTLPRSAVVGESTREYLYYVVERSVVNGSETITLDTFTATGAEYPTGGTFATDYEVKYLNNNGVDSNTENNPITIENTYIWYKLPNTGGIGTTKVYILGAFLIAAGTLGGYAIRKRERRSG